MQSGELSIFINGNNRNMDNHCKNYLKARTIAIISTIINSKTY